VLKTYDHNNECVADLQFEHNNRISRSHFIWALQSINHFDNIIGKIKDKEIKDFRA
jgi:hypothetical protein